MRLRAYIGPESSLIEIWLMPLTRIYLIVLSSAMNLMEVRSASSMYEAVCASEWEGSKLVDCSVNEDQFSCCYCVSEDTQICTSAHKW